MNKYQLYTLGGALLAAVSLASPASASTVACPPEITAAVVIDQAMLVQMPTDAIVIQPVDVAYVRSPRIVVPRETHAVVRSIGSNVVTAAVEIVVAPGGALYRRSLG